MTTPADIPIVTYQDILDAVERDPALHEKTRRHLLGEEYLHLPEMVANLAATVKQISDIVAATAQSQTRTETDVADLKEGQARTEADISELKEGQAELKAGQARTETEVSRIDRTVASMQATLNSMRGTLNRLDGTDYERTAARRIRRSGGRRLGLTRPVIVQARTLPENDIIPSLLDNAIAAGRITEEQADEIDLVDIIARGSDPNGILTYAAVEVSLTVEPHDVTRARARADLLALAANAPVKAAAIGTDITDDAQNEALSHDVTCIALPQSQ